MKKIFEVEGKEYAVVTPTPDVRRESQIEHSRVFGNLLKAGGILTRVELDKLMDKNEIWDAESKKEYRKLSKEVIADSAKLDAGNMKLNKGRELALSIADKRIRLNELSNEYRRYDNITADAHAENAALDYTICKCLVDNETGKQIYEDLDAYLDDKDSVVASMAYINMLQLEHGSTDELSKRLPENKFLLEWKFVDKDLRFINKDGALIDRDGKLVNDSGEYLDQDEDEVESKPFLDDDGNPIEKPQ
jgi:hypothetical protein